MSAARRRARGRRPEQGADGRAWSVARKAYAGIAALGVIIGVIAGAIGLIDRLGGGSGSAGETGPIDPEITSVRTGTTSEPLGDYLRLTHQPTASFSAAQLRQPGYEFEVGLRIRGLTKKKLTLEWSMYRRRGGGDVERLTGPVYNQVAADTIPQSPDHSTRWPVWVPHPPSAGAYVVRFLLRDQRGLPVSRHDSPPIRYQSS